MKWLHNLMKGASLTGALFVFQACYGMPQDPMFESGEAPMSFSLVSRTTGEPIQGVRILGTEYKKGSYRELGTTDGNGNCRVSIPYVRNAEGPFLRFEDPEHHFDAKDTTLADLRERDIIIKLYPTL